MITAEVHSESIQDRDGVERTFAWLSNFRRISKDYEHSPLTSKNNILFNMITSMLTKLAA